MVLVAVIDVEDVAQLVAAFLGETVVLDIANLAFAVVPGEGAGIKGVG